MPIKKTTLLLLLAILFAAAAAYGVGLLLGQANGDSPGADAGDAGLVALGERIYGQNCSRCHGPDLKGEPNWQTRRADDTLPAPPHDETGHSWHHSDALLFDYTKKGGQALLGNDVKSAMPGFAETLSDRDIWAALAFIKSRWPATVQARQARLNTGSQ
jgi:mono/diheme cytochrome c family protein